jgi:ABC-type nickel/cobalt efflux system permease component RcnA
MKRTQLSVVAATALFISLSSTSLLASNDSNENSQVTVKHDSQNSFHKESHEDHEDKADNENDHEDHEDKDKNENDHEDHEDDED